MGGKKKKKKKKKIEVLAKQTSEHTSTEDMNL